MGVSMGRFTKFPESALIRRLAEATERRLVQQVIQRVRNLNYDGSLSGDDSGLTDAWEEVCAQEQGTRSFMWDAYEAQLLQIIDTVLEEDECRPCLEAVWLQSPRGEEWLAEVEEEEEQAPYDHIPFGQNELAYWILKAVLAEAANDDSPRVREYLDRY
jgi:hypothetical protein